MVKSKYPKVAIVLGTRPEIIKMAPIIRLCKKQGINYFVLHTGQHYSYSMDRQIFRDLELQRPRYNLNVGGHHYRKQIGYMVPKIMEVLKKESVDLVIVQGDTNSVLAGALAANKAGVKIAHHEAGYRSHNLAMLEETNRIITDHISDFLFASTNNAYRNLVSEGIPKYKVFLTGNTVVDTLRQNIKIAMKKSRILKKLSLRNKKYILTTAHRAEIVDVPDRLASVIAGLDAVAKNSKLPIIYPIHPWTEQNLKEFGIKVPSQIRLVKPLGYLDTLLLIQNAKLVLTDSGGIQEEAAVLRVPTVILRDETERIELVRLGLSFIAGSDPAHIISGAKKMLKSKLRWSNPFGDGHAAEKILSALNLI